MKSLTGTWDLWTKSTFESASTNGANPTLLSALDGRNRIDDSQSKSNGLRGVKNGPATQDLSMADFLARKFVPDYLSTKQSAGRAHYHAMLKHVLNPEVVDRIFAVEERHSRTRLRTIAGWPYLDGLRLMDVKPEDIHKITDAALKHGYSTQTAAHIRNVIRRIFAYAGKIGYFTGSNPASVVKVPQITPKRTPVLSPDQLKRVLLNLRYPEREIALLSLLTDMTVGEICALQWRYVNLSDKRRMVEGEWQGPCTIVVAKQSYRGEIVQLASTRRRHIAVSDLLLPILVDLRCHKRFTHGDAFVFSSRNGTPINQDNLATRRLKPIARRIDMPWLCWSVFHRTHVSLTKKYGRRLHAELKKWLPSTWLLSAGHQPSPSRLTHYRPVYCKCCEGGRSG